MTHSPNKASPAQGLLHRHFLDEMEDVLVGRLRTEARSDARRTELMEKTGIRDSRLLSELAGLGLTTNSLVALRLIPLVLVAWADKHVDKKEHAAVIRIAKELGIRSDSDAYITLEHWLREMPPGISLDAWTRYMDFVMQRMSWSARQKLIRYFETQMTTVAQASGGLLGIGKTSHRERQVIDKILGLLRAPRREALKN